MASSHECSTKPKTAQVDNHKKEQGRLPQMACSRFMFPVVRASRLHAQLSVDGKVLLKHQVYGFVCVPYIVTFASSITAVAFSLVLERTQQRPR